MKALEISFDDAARRPVLHRFRVKEGKERRLMDWLEEVRQRKDECRDSMIWERSIMEAVFTSEEEDGLFVYWLVIQKAGARSIVKSPHDIDAEHIEVLHECLEIDANRNRTALKTHWELRKKRWFRSPSSSRSIIFRDWMVGYLRFIKWIWDEVTWTKKKR